MSLGELGGQVERDGGPARAALGSVDGGDDGVTGVADPPGQGGQVPVCLLAPQDHRSQFHGLNAVLGKDGAETRGVGGQEEAVPVRDDRDGARLVDQGRLAEDVALIEPRHGDRVVGLGLDSNVAGATLDEVQASDGLVGLDHPGARAELDRAQAPGQPPQLRVDQREQDGRPLQALEGVHDPARAEPGPRRVRPGGLLSRLGVQGYVRGGVSLHLSPW